MHWVGVETRLIASVQELGVLLPNASRGASALRGFPTLGRPTALRASYGGRLPLGEELALSVRVASCREAMPLAQPKVEKALRCAIRYSNWRKGLGVRSVLNSTANRDCTS
ncbi:MAG: hypothetical protein V7L25_25715 [Nostoc sp.]|uniref:hypothetical protein n=1 Tax=Nostoc sp. TaxID=1180 RepID=UPI002FF366C8